MTPSSQARAWISWLIRAATLPRAIAVGACLLVLLPVLVNAMPPLVDYPNHVVRFWLLSGGASHPPMSRFFQVDWSHTATNIAMDAVAVMLDFVFSAEMTGRIILGLAAVLPPIGMVLVSRQLFGRLSYWHILIGLTAWTLVLLTGFMSFQLGLGAALIAVWLDSVLAGKDRLKTVARQSLQVAAVVLVHPFGALFYILLATGVAIGAEASLLIDPRQWRALAKRLGWTFLPFLLAGAGIGLRSIMIGHEAVSTAFILPALEWYDPGWAHMNIDHVFWAFVGPLRSYSLPVDIAFIAMLWLPVVIAAVQKNLRLHAGLVVTGLGLFLFSLVCPQGIGSTSMVDVRLWTMAQLMMPVALYPCIDLSRTPVKIHAAALLCTLALLTVGARAVWLTFVWQQRQADVASLYRAMEPIPAGARVLPLKGAEDNGEDLPRGRYLGGMTVTFGHLPTLAVMRRQAYVPTVFAEPGKQPLRVREPYEDSHEVSGGLLGTAGDLQKEDTGVAGYMNSNWRTNFDYVLMVDARSAPDNVISNLGLCLVTDQGFARLYRIGRPSGVCS